MTGLTASRFGLIDRGKLAVGAFADVTVVRSRATVIDRAAFRSRPSRSLRHPICACKWRLSVA